MARLFGLIGNRVDMTAAVLAHEAEALRVRRGACAWGIGFHHGGEVLLRRRPTLPDGAVDLAAMAREVRTDVLVGHARGAAFALGDARAENTAPFRYRQWLFAQTGRIARFEGVREALVASVPEFLRSNIRGETDAEVLFHVFLSFLHDAGRLTPDATPAEAIADALRAALAQVDAMSIDAAGEPAAVNVLVSDGESVTALRRGAPMALRAWSGRHDADRVLGDDAALRPRIPALSQMRFSLVASDFDGDEVPADWQPVGARAIVSLRRGVDPVVLED